VRIFLFSDVHGNLEALEATLADAGRRGYDRAICLGDIVGYGADPEACVRTVAKVAAGSTVLGNHDAAVISPSSRHYLNAAAQAGVMYSERALSPESLSYLGSLPLVIEGNGFVATHSSPFRPEQWIYVLEPVDARDALGAMTRPVAFVGHTHYPALHDGGGVMKSVVPGRPLALNAGQKCIVNVGSVGQPRDGDPKSAYMIFDEEHGVAELFRVEYDVDSAARKILEAGLPTILADRIRRGY
jgi:diadenosine tetraphosphatase ApaH/serine/threonine PP2A family protein phosphatase